MNLDGVSTRHIHFLHPMCKSLFSEKDIQMQNTLPPMSTNIKPFLLLVILAWSPSHSHYSELQNITCSFEPLQNFESWLWLFQKQGTCPLCQWHRGVKTYEFDTIRPNSTPWWPGNSSHPHTESYRSFCNSESWHNFSGLQREEEVWPPPSQCVLISCPGQTTSLYECLYLG